MLTASHTFLYKRLHFFPFFLFCTCEIRHKVALFVQMNELEVVVVVGGIFKRPPCKDWLSVIENRPALT